MAKTKIICDGVTRICFTCKKPYPIECFTIRGGKDKSVIRNGRCKFCINDMITQRNRFLTAFHKNAKLVLSYHFYRF